MDFDLNTIGPTILKPESVDCTIFSKLEKSWKEYLNDDSLIVFSSGTSGNSKVKCFQHSKQNLIRKSKIINQVFNIGAEDRFITSLPKIHIGGYSIFLRSACAQATLIEDSSKWSPVKFYEKLVKENITILSLVPTQLHDLISMGYKSPKSLRIVYLGGDKVSPTILDKAIDLGWPIVLCYGMTESASQIAYKMVGDTGTNEFLQLYPEHNIIKNTAGYELNSPFVCSRSFVSYDDKIEITNYNNFLLEDNIELIEKDDIQYIKILGRKGRDFNYKGKLYNLDELHKNVSHILDEYDLFNSVLFTTIDDLRTGKKLGIKLLKGFEYEKELIDKLNDSLMNPQICFVEYYDEKNLTELGKVRF